MRTYDLITLGPLDRRDQPSILRKAEGGSLAQFTATQRLDPYKNFKFLVKCDGKIRRRNLAGQRAQT
jgi:hypothetical protein